MSLPYGLADTDILLLGGGRGGRESKSEEKGSFERATGMPGRRRNSQVGRGNR